MKDTLNTFAKFGSVGIQMGLTIYLASKLGEWLDIEFAQPKPFYSKICVLLGVALSFVSLMVQLKKMEK